MKIALEGGMEPVIPSAGSAKATFTVFRTEIEPVTVGVPEIPTEPVTATVLGTVIDPVTVGVPTMDAETAPEINCTPPVVTAKG